MTTEMTIFLLIFIGVAIASVFIIVDYLDTKKYSEKLEDLTLKQRDALRKQSECIAEMNDLLKKQDSIISILRIEIKEKENKK